MRLHQFIELLRKRNIIVDSRNAKIDITNTIFKIPIKLVFEKKKEYKVELVNCIVNLQYKPCDIFYFKDYDLDMVFRYTINNVSALFQIRLERNISTETRINHPLFHLHFGGKQYEEFLRQITNQNILHFDEPRIPHYPMDIVLCIDFLLVNFSPHIRERIEKDNIYKTTLMESQRKYLLPYYKKIQYAKSDDNFRRLLPNIMFDA